ncbi:MAG: hypothetical protein LIO77_08550 [Rikenellaceae bacterium]|nr:hypothetical protein [Rikenellaceae bacterium]
MEKMMTSQESLSLIVNMIEQAKGDFRKGGGKYFLLWGYVVALASILHFISVNIAVLDCIDIYIWPGVLLAGLGFTVYFKMRDRSRQSVKTYVGYMLGRIWAAFGIAVVLIYILLWNHNGLMIYPAISLIYTMALFLSASAFKLRWMYISVAVCVVCMVLYGFLSPVYQPLVMAAMITAGNIVPGHILNIKGRGNV